MVQPGPLFLNVRCRDTVPYNGSLAMGPLTNPGRFSNSFAPAQAAMSSTYFSLSSHAAVIHLFS